MYNKKNVDLMLTAGDITKVKTESTRLKTCIYSPSLCTVHTNIAQQSMVKYHQLEYNSTGVN